MEIILYCIAVCAVAYLAIKVVQGGYALDGQQWVADCVEAGMAKEEIEDLLLIKMAADENPLFIAAASVEIDKLPDNKE